MLKPIRSFIVLALTILFLVYAGISAAQESPGEITICVLPFEINASPDLQYLQADLPELLADELRAQGFSVVPQQVVHQTIRAQGFQYLDLDVAKQLAVLTGAQYSLYGSFSQVGDTISLDARLVEAFGVEAPKPLYVTKQGLMSVLPAVQQLAGDVRGNILITEVIGDILVSGTEILDEDVVLMRLRIQPGDMYDPNALDAEIKRIFDLGYFEDVRVDVQDVDGKKVLTFEVVERPRIGAISIIGSGEIDEDEILDTMATKPGSVLNPKILAEDLNNIRDLYRQEALFGTEVDYEIEQGDTAQARLNILVSEAPKLYVTEIVFEGNEYMDDGDLSGTMALSERSILSWITGSGVMSQDLIDHDLAAIDNLYNDNGFVEAQVGQPDVEYLEDGIRVTFHIIEGPQYTIGDINFAGDVLMPDDVLYEGIELDDWAEDEGYFNRSVMREDANKLTRAYNDFGYAYAEVELGIDKDDENHVLNVTYNFIKSHKVMIRRVIIEGNDKTRDNVIRRSMVLGDGNLFNGTRLKMTQINLEKLQLFETVEIETVPTEDPSLLDLKVTVKEQSTGSISGGLGYSTSESMLVSAQIQETNLFGMGYGMALNAGFSGSSTNYNLGFTNPRVYDTYLMAGINTFYQERELTDYDRRSLGAQFRFSYPIGDWTKVFWGYQLEQYTLFNIDDDASEYIQENSGENWSSVFNIGISRDTTDRLLNPTSGNSNSITLNYGGGLLGGDDHFIKIQADTNWYFTLIEDWKHVLHLHARAGRIFENYMNEDVPVFERFYLGGMNSIRGYGPLKIGPRDDGDRIGGETMFFANVEYLFPLEDEFGLMGVLFYDMGDAWGGGDHDTFILKKSVGFGIRWYSPFGPMRVECGYALDEIDDQGDRFRVDFTVGQFF